MPAKLTHVMLDPMLFKELNQCLSWCVASESLVLGAYALVLDVSTTPGLIWVLGSHVGSDISGRERCVRVRCRISSQQGGIRFTPQQMSENGTEKQSGKN